MSKERAITYSLLTHIRNTGTLVSGPMDIFKPLIKRTLSEMNKHGVSKGKTLFEIKTIADKQYSIDFPIPVLRLILEDIAKEINKNGVVYFKLYQDGAFSLLNEYTFTEYEDIIKKQKLEIDKIETLFTEFCRNSDFQIEESVSIFTFIEQNKFNLSRYFSHDNVSNESDFTAEAQFISFFKNISQVYNKIKDIYLGSIISHYIQYNPNDIKSEIELLLDTNFITGLLDLNTKESSHTCNTLLDIAIKQDFKISILKDTIDEIKNLIGNKAEYFDTSFLVKKVNQEDIYNACDRRCLKRSDLERIKDNIETTLYRFGIEIVEETNDLKDKAKDTDEYKWLKKIRSSNISALHDTIAILYIKKKRGGKIKNFEDVNAWFVNNSFSRSYMSSKQLYQPELIKADDLLNILWLSNPQKNQIINAEDLAEIGITSSISLSLNSKLPKAQILKELDDNINKYAKEKISDKDILRVATRITNKQLQDVEEINKIASQDKEEFVKRLETEAAKQRKLEEKRIYEFKSLFRDIAEKSKELEAKNFEFSRKLDDINVLSKEKNRSDLEIKKLEEELLEEKNKLIEKKRTDWINTQIQVWRKKTWFELLFFLILFMISFIFLLYISSWDIKNAISLATQLKTNFIASSIISIFSFIFLNFTIKSIYDKYRNFSNIENYKKSLEIPIELNTLKQLR